MASTNDIKKTQVVPIVLDCSDGKTRSFSVPISLGITKVSGMYVSQIVATTGDSKDANATYKIYSDLVPLSPYIALITAGQTPTPQCMFLMNGEQVNGQHTFRVDDVTSTATTMHYVVTLLLQFIEKS